jgi:hypothetical protein
MPLLERRVVPVSPVRGLGLGAQTADAAVSPRISLFMEYLQLMSCQNYVIMGRATPSPG